MKTFFDYYKPKDTGISDLVGLIKTDEDLKEVAIDIYNTLNDLIINETDHSKRLNLIALQEAGFWNGVGNFAGNAISGVANAVNNFGQGYNMAMNPNAPAGQGQPGQAPSSLMANGRNGKSAIQSELEALGQKLTAESPAHGKVFMNSVNDIVRKMLSIPMDAQVQQPGAAAPRTNPAAPRTNPAGNPGQQAWQAGMNNMAKPAAPQAPHFPF